MAIKDFKVWLDLYKETAVCAPYDAQENKYVTPFFSSGDLYGNFLRIEVQKSGEKLTLTNETAAVYYYIESQNKPIYTQSFGNGISIVNGEIEVELSPAVFAFIGKMSARVKITDADDRVSTGELRFNIVRGDEGPEPDDSWYKITAYYVTQAEYDLLESQGKIEQNRLYIITDAEGDLLINNANTINIIDSGGYYSGNTVEGALQEIGQDIGSITDNIGTQLYTEENYVVDGETITASIDKLDQNLNLVQIESGETNGVAWTKFPDGTLFISGRATITNFSTSSVDVSLPAEFTNVLFTATASATYFASSTATASFVVECMTTSNSSIRIKALVHSTSGVSSVSANTGVMFNCVGRWK